MDKIEQKANEAYPFRWPGGGPTWADARRIEGYIDGYKQAEKDLELTWEDMKTIIELDGNVGECDDFHGSQKYYEKVLEMFKEKRK